MAARRTAYFGTPVRRQTTPSLHQCPDALGRGAVFFHQPDQVPDRDPQLIAPPGELALVVDVDLVGVARNPFVRVIRATRRRVKIGSEGHRHHALVTFSFGSHCGLVWYPRGAAS